MPGLYILPSSWLLDATPEAVWETVASPDMSWPRWWPGCTLQDLATDPRAEADAETADPTAELLATTVRLRFRAALGYHLSITIHPTAAARPRIIEFDAGGDLAGTGRIRLFPVPAAAPGNAPGGAAQTRMDIDWRVRPTRPWMRLLTPVARPVFTAAHSLLMRQGERGLRRELAGSGNPSRTAEEGAHTG
ncbi:hypothetical protein [Arthrobacter sp. zg-Y1116]|uniref:hypothetical protein n=1 Tax=Arthrobacter sp. zg-Y1116 TaxID=2964611 RepID=UPI002103E21A|nr:hypothetical protein [Arthrobacter sp. zg-Y1116]MCQ1946871.1 hypothetical protein [Arthrobacter sp. zg-Y1116]